MSFLIHQVQGNCRYHRGAHSLASAHHQLKTHQCKLELERLQSTAKRKLSNGKENKNPWYFWNTDYIAQENTGVHGRK